MAGTWEQHQVAGHPCDVYEPRQRHPQGFVVLYLHGVHLGSLRDKGPFLETFDQLGLPVVAPQAGPTWWTDRISSAFDPQLSAERFVREHVLQFIERQFGSAARVGLLGTSMGGQGALRLAFKYPRAFPVVAAISPAIDYYTRMDEGDEILNEMYEDPESARQDSALLHIHPLNWPPHIFFSCDPADERWFDSADRLHMKLRSLGIPYEIELQLSAGGHGFEYYNAMASRAVQFIHDRLERERLSLR